MITDHTAVYDLFAEYGALIDMARFDEWLDLFAQECRYQIIPRENFDRGLPAALVFCDSRAALEDRIRALREANKYNIHIDRHVIGLPRILDDGLAAEAAFAVYQTDQEGETRLFATGLYRDCFAPARDRLKIRDKLILLDTFAVPTLLATPL
jgi:anthranilate 1,2-dioxygenase small subunit